MPKTLSVIIPVYNEAAYVVRSLENVVQTCIPGWKMEIVAVNDGSTDNTLALLQDFSRQRVPLKIINSSQNMGKGSALKTGIRKATGEILIIQDADLEYDPSDYPAILGAFENKEVNVVYGSRVLGAKAYHNYSANWLFYLGGITLTKITNLLLKTTLTDQPTCYKAWRNSLSAGLLKYCRGNGFEFEVEATAYFAKHPRIAEVPIHYYPRSIGHGKKIRLPDFLKSVVTLFRCAFGKPLPQSA